MFKVNIFASVIFMTMLLHGHVHSMPTIKHRRKVYMTSYVMQMVGKFDAVHKVITSFE